jgi:hypothetical protein
MCGLVLLGRAGLVIHLHRCCKVADLGLMLARALLMLSTQQFSLLLLLLPGILLVLLLLPVVGAFCCPAWQPVHWQRLLCDEVLQRAQGADVSSVVCMAIALLLLTPWWMLLGMPMINVP